ncbi:acyl-[acyl-carrier-protein] thioesterase [Pseudoramibacter alactolyticus]
MGKIFERPQAIATYDCLEDHHLSPVAVMNYFQQISLEHSASLKAGPYELSALDLTWIVVKYHVDFWQMPRFLDQLQLGTWASAFKGFTAHRGFFLKNQSGEHMVDGQSHWMMVDRRQNHIVRVNEVPINAVYDVEDQGPRFKMPRLARIKDWENVRQFSVRYLDIDYNGHVNNVCYLAWALACLPAVVLQTRTLKTLDIVFKEQALYGDVVTVKDREIAPDCYRVDIFNANETLLTQLQLQF